MTTSTFNFLNQKFYVYDFWKLSEDEYKEPKFYTLKEWFEKERIDK